MNFVVVYLKKNYSPYSNKSTEKFCNLLKILYQARISYKKYFFLKFFNLRKYSFFGILIKIEDNTNVI